MIKSLRRLVTMKLWQEQEYCNEQAFHLIGWTKALSYALHKYVMHLLETQFT